MSKHTPGPWRCRGAGAEVLGNSRIVATMAWCSGMGEEDSANARLIAAAPIMYKYIASSASNGCAEARHILDMIDAST